MSVQTNMSTNFVSAIAGDVRGDAKTLTRVTTVALNNGLFCCVGANENKCKLPTSAAEVAKGYGVARSDVSRDPNFPPGGTASTTYQIGDSVETVYRGQVWVKVEDSVVQFGAVYVRFADGNSGNVQKGAFRSDADTVSSAATAAAVTGARYLTAASAGQLALVDLNLPQ